MTRTTTYTTDGGDLVIEFDYQEHEEATDVAPATPESAYVCSVMAGPFEILDLCNEPYIEFFKEKCLKSVQFERDNSF